jgi:hypothetical protein
MPGAMFDTGFTMSNSARLCAARFGGTGGDYTTIGAARHRCRIA